MAFCWSDATVAWTNNVMLIVGIFAVPFSYSILARWGLRLTVVWGGAGALALGSVLRCVSMSGSVLKWTSFLCGALNGWSSIMIECTLTVLSVKWFPADERTTATGVVIATQMSGLIPPALVFPYIVTEPPSGNTSCTDPANTELVQEIKTDVSYILYTEAAITSIIFLAMLVYFPSSPPSPPSPSATAERYNVKKGLVNIFTSFKNIMIGLAFASINIPMMWITVANQNLNHMHMTQVTENKATLATLSFSVSRKTPAISEPSSLAAQLS